MMAPSALEDGTYKEDPLASMAVVHYALSKDKRKPTFVKNINIHQSTSRPVKSHLEALLEAKSTVKDL
jgi:hypothetical protein